MKDFWISSGHHLVDHDESGHLVASDEFLRAFLARPEILPPEEACAAERALHAKLVTHPRAEVKEREIAAIEDEDARENWRLYLRFRDLLLTSPSLEAAYLTQFREGRPALPWLFINQLTQLILRNALDRQEDAFTLKAAELFFRRQKLSLDGGQLLLADADLIEDRQVAAHASPLLAMFQGEGAGGIEVLSAANAEAYRGRSDAFDLVLDFHPQGPGREGLARVMEIWIRHLLGIDSRIEPIDRLEGKTWSWFVGLDQQASEIGNALWRGEEPPHNGRERILGLFRMSFLAPHVMLDNVAGEPVYFILATDKERFVHMKPQNLITGLPLKTAEMALG